jgi:hypothetical protein
MPSLALNRGFHALLLGSNLPGTASQTLKRAAEGTNRFRDAQKPKDIETTS